MKAGRLWELTLVVGIIAFYLNFVQSPDSPPPERVQRGVQTEVRTVSLGETVPSFVLKDSAGTDITHQEGEGPVLIVLTATGCEGCLNRIQSEDLEAYRAAQNAGVPAWNMLVYHPQERALDFERSHRPQADHVLADPSAATSVRMLGGSDSTCWMLLDEDGKLAYRGGVDIEALNKALRAL